VLLLLLRRS